MTVNDDPESLRAVAKRVILDFVKFSVLLTFILASVIFFHEISERNGQFLIFLHDVNQGHTTVATLTFFGALAFITFTLCEDLSFAYTFLENNPHGWTLRATQKVRLTADLCRKKTGYVGALLAQHTVRITISILVISVSLNVNNSIEWNTPIILALIIKIAAVLMITSNILSVAVRAVFINLVTRRTIEDAELENSDE